MTRVATVEQTSDGINGVVTALRNDPQLQECIQCGTCSGICPYGYVMVYPPSKMIAALRAGTFENVLKNETIWMCISCSACTDACPAGVPITENLMTRTKEELLLMGAVPAELQAALEFSQRYGNPLGESRRKRADWVKESSTPIQILDKQKTEVDVLWFVGDYASYHPKVQSDSKAFAEILNTLGVDFGILGRDENSDGESQRLAGEHGLFEMLTEKNIASIENFKYNVIVTTDPHAYNAFVNEYPKLGHFLPVMHYTQYLYQHLGDLKPFLKKEIKAKVTYHDACYLGRVNDIYTEPRALLSAIPGVELVEMAHCKENSLCCGGGGGGMWMDGFIWEHAHVRLSEWRVKEAVRAGAEILAVACPYEVSRFEDATKTITEAENLIVKDISQLLVESMKS